MVDGQWEKRVHPCSDKHEMAVANAGSESRPGLASRLARAGREKCCAQFRLDL